MHFARALFFISSVAIGFLGFPGGVPGLVVGFLFAVVVIALEIKLHTIHPNALMGGIVGTSIGLVMAIGFGISARQLDLSNTQEAVLQGVVLLALAYLGMIIGAIKGQQGEWWLPWKHFVDRGVAGLGPSEKIIDTSVIIDGRIRELVDTGFIEGHAGGAAVRVARVAAGGRLQRRAQACAGPPWPRHSAWFAGGVGSRCRDRVDGLRERARGR